MSEKSPEERVNWYAIYTKPMEESRVELNLKSRGIETFAPKIKARRDNQFTGKPVYVTTPLFSRYTFAKFNLAASLHKVNFMRGVQYVVRFDGCPVVIDDEVIEIIRSRVNEKGFVRLDDFQPGDKVIIKSGPFKNLTGIFNAALKDNERVSVFLTAVSYQNRVVVEKDLVLKVDVPAM
jgi:transcription elongation factor/antiterminator RfaH